MQTQQQYQPRRTESQWRIIFEQWQKSELSIRQFCDANDVSHQSFYKWKQKFVNKLQTNNTEPVFIDLSSMENNSPHRWHIVLKLDDGMELQLSRD